ncbi:MAG TPA: hypothetical protein VFM79_09025, partial [Pelobium sp.]|nr:hypothetical protein [Pelobium sp.]
MIKKLTYCILFAWIACVATNVKANPAIDSLKRLLKNDKLSQEMTLAELCWEYKYSQPDSAKFYGSQAVKLASKNKNLPALSIAYH